MLVEKTQIMDQKAMLRAITRISFEIIEHNKGASNLYIIGIMTRGAELAQRVAKKISELEGTTVEVGYLDVTAYRDDKRSGEGRQDRTDLPFSIEGKQIILVDDVIYTGRTVRAAMDAILQRGRAKSIQLAALIDRGHSFLSAASRISRRTPCPSLPMTTAARRRETVRMSSVSSRRAVAYSGSSAACRRGNSSSKVPSHTGRRKQAPMVARRVLGL